MNKFLNKKIYKTIPLWSVMALLMTAGVGYATLTWISNSINVGVTVTEWEILLNNPTGTFTDLKVGDMASPTFPYDVNDPLDKTGYVHVRFTFKSGHTVSLNDIAFQGCRVTRTPLDYDHGGPLTGYPVIDGNSLVYICGISESAFDFGDTDGEIAVLYVPLTTEIQIMTVQITSAVP